MNFSNLPLEFINSEFITRNVGRYLLLVVKVLHNKNVLKSGNKKMNLLRGIFLITVPESVYQPFTQSQGKLVNLQGSTVT